MGNYSLGDEIETSTTPETPTTSTTPNPPTTDSAKNKSEYDGYDGYDGFDEYKLKKRDLRNPGANGPKYFSVKISPNGCPTDGEVNATSFCGTSTELQVRFEYIAVIYCPKKLIEL